MPNVTRLDKLRKLISHARNRAERREDTWSRELDDWREGAGNSAGVSDARTAYTEALSGKRALEDAYFNERLSQDMDNATGDGRRFIEEVVQFVGPRQPYPSRGIYEQGGPKKVPQKKIRQMGEYWDAYNLNEIPGTVQTQFLDKSGMGMRPEEAYWSEGVYGVNGKYFKNLNGDDFYVPNRSSEVFRR